jgi:hypothetical protein
MIAHLAVVHYLELEELTHGVYLSCEYTTLLGSQASQPKSGHACGGSPASMLHFWNVFDMPILFLS